MRIIIEADSDYPVLKTDIPDKVYLLAVMTSSLSGLINEIDSEELMEKVLDEIRINFRKEGILQ